MILLSGYAKSNKLVQTIVLSIVCAFFVRNCLVMRNNTVLMTINSIKNVNFTKLYNLFSYCQIT